MDIRAFFRQFRRWPTIRAVPTLDVSATAPPPNIRYVRACDLPFDIDASSVEPWRTDAGGEQWFRIVEGYTDD